MRTSLEIERGRAAHERRAWPEVFEALAAADAIQPLAADDLERLAMAAYLTGRDEDHSRTLERAYQARRAAGDDAGAARCAFWIGFLLLFRGEMGRATGWLGRAERLVGDRACVERGYLLLPAAGQQFHQGSYDAAIAVASEAATIGERFGDADLIGAARHLEGCAYVARGDVPRGLAVLDEVMVAVTSGELSPIMAGLVYCSVIESCQQAWALDRAGEWTAALARWCDAQQGLVAFTTTCLVRRAEILQFHGEWRDAIREARRACERVARLPDRRPPAAAFYQQAEVHRLRGEFAKAEEAYRDASRGGSDPQPGLSLLRLAQGRTDAAAGAIRRAVAATTGPLTRARLLPAQVEILVAAGDVENARAAAAELETIARHFGASALHAMAAEARGQVQLADGDAAAALTSLRRAWRAWQDIDAPYLAARARVLIGLTCRVLGDDDGCALEFDAARAVFERLGAAPALDRLERLRGRSPAASLHGLSARELQVIRLVAAGKTNRTVATELSISEKTVARHVSNIFTKLGLSTRAAATAYAYEHGLV
jgi:ATP/maltotriose-dependent transcriptional regulator MalT